MPFPKTLRANPKIIFFTDFDGTITLQDTNDFITDTYGFGVEERLKWNNAVLDGLPFRDGFQRMLDSWTTSLPETISILKKTIKLDPHFSTFMAWADAHAVPVILLSSGMEPVIRALLAELMEDKELAARIEIVANDAQPIPPRNDFNQAQGWSIKYHDDSGFGHDKSLTIRPYAEAIAKMPEGTPRPTLLYAGDGVSDLSAARETDLLFAKAGKDLITYCEREKIPFTVFEDWRSILQTTREIFEGKTDVNHVVEETLELVRTNSLPNGIEKRTTNDFSK